MRCLCYADGEASRIVRMMGMLANFHAGWKMGRCIELFFSCAVLGLLLVLLAPQWGTVSGRQYAVEHIQEEGSLSVLTVFALLMIVVKCFPS